MIIIVITKKLNRERIGKMYREKNKQKICK